MFEQPNSSTSVLMKNWQKNQLQDTNIPLDYSKIHLSFKLVFRNKDDPFSLKETKKMITNKKQQPETQQQQKSKQSKTVKSF